jgi:hypothetical protein
LRLQFTRSPRNHNHGILNSQYSTTPLAVLCVLPFLKSLRIFQHEFEE